MAALTVLFAGAGVTHAEEARWVEGRNYDLINPAQPTHVPAGRVEVVEVFSYGCPACNQFQPIMAELAAKLPKKAQLVYVA
ncbi:MAG TPA: hypothetical protein PK555_11780, partial [Steroidobacteraceae bacterium]|nr:hypothetical protein [Steroidobacteraceae bacterium]